MEISSHHKSSQHSTSRTCVLVYDRVCACAWVHLRACLWLHTHENAIDVYFFTLHIYANVISCFSLSTALVVLVRVCAQVHGCIRARVYIIHMQISTHQKSSQHMCTCIYIHPHIYMYKYIIKYVYIYIYVFLVNSPVVFSAQHFSYWSSISQMWKSHARGVAPEIGSACIYIHMYDADIYLYSYILTYTHTRVHV